MRPYRTTVSFNATMFITLLAVCSAMLCPNSPWVSTARAKSKSVIQKVVDKPQIEVCFVLDTTGSMGGLIEGAKRKIWSITNDLISTKPTPSIKIGMIAYRDRTDAYTTKNFNLTDDIDEIYGHLMKFKADGGGDTPESVNQALHEAVTKMSWSKNKKVLKVIFLVGDAPPHMDYKDDVKYPETCKLAVKNDLIINTVQCGKIGSTRPIWQQIARLSEGSFVALGQTGDMVAVATPYDKEIAALSDQIGDTVIAYGNAAAIDGVTKKLARAKAAPAPSKADRSAALSKSEGTVVTGHADLVQSIELGSVKLKDIKENKLPDKLKKMKPKEREDYIKQQSAKRTEIQKKLTELVKKRDSFVIAERKKLAGKGKKDAFDEKVAEIITEQAKRKR